MFYREFFYYVAIPSTVILFIQSVLTLIGMGVTSDADMDFDADMEGDVSFDVDPEVDASFDLDDEGFETSASGADFRFVTFRGIIAFLTMFGWVGASLAQTTIHLVLIVVLSLVAGLMAMLVIAMLFYGISKLQSSGNISYRRAIGKDAIVYIPIPPNKEGFGKIQLTLQERLIEVNAVTEEPAMIGSNTNVRIIDMLNATTFVVERI